MESLSVWGANGTIYSSLFTRPGGHLKASPLRSRKWLSGKSWLGQATRFTCVSSRCYITHWAKMMQWPLTSRELPLDGMSGWFAQVNKFTDQAHTRAHSTEIGPQAWRRGLSFISISGTLRAVADLTQGSFMENKLQKPWGRSAGIKLVTL